MYCLFCQMNSSIQGVDHMYQEWVKTAGGKKAKLGEICKLIKSASWWNLQQWDYGLRQKSGRAHRWVWAQNCNVKLGEIWKLVKSTSMWNLQVGETGKRSERKRETGWNWKVGKICKFVRSVKVGTMDLGQNPAEPAGVCGLRIVRWNWVKSKSLWNL